MNLKEDLQHLVEAQKKTQKLRFDAIGLKQDEALKYEKLTNMCNMKVEELHQEMMINDIYINKLTKIIKKL